jgi:hypothetical protein
VATAHSASAGNFFRVFMTESSSLMIKKLPSNCSAKTASKSHHALCFFVAGDCRVRSELAARL